MAAQRRAARRDLDLPRADRFLRDRRRSSTRSSRRPSRSASSALSLTAGLTLIIGTFLLFISRRLEHARPEDNDDAEVADGAGDVGFFSPGSYWPFFLAFSVAMIAVATAYLLWWLMVIGVGFLFFSICGLIFEYHRRPTH